MKTLMQLTFTALLWSMGLQGQINFTDDIYLGPTPGNVQSLPSPGAWGATHGTPSYSPDKIGMWATRNQDGYIGEGVYRVMDIVESANYSISIGINFFKSSNSANPESFYVVLANDPIPPVNAIHGSPIPTWNNARVLYINNGPNFTQKKELILKFSTALGESYKYLVIYPRQETYNQHSTELEIECVTAYSCASGNQTYCGTIPGGTKLFKNIYIGSGFCGTSGVAVSSPGSNTLLRATEKIDVTKTTDITVNNFRSFVMEVDNSCVGLFQADIPQGQVQQSLINKEQLCIYLKTAMGSEQEESEVIPERNQELSIYPNPTNDLVHIPFTDNGLAHVVTVFSIDGRVLNEYSIRSAEETVSLKDYPDGIYLLRINSGHESVVKKIVKKE